MKRRLARWFISREMDAGTPIPAWVASWIAHDPELKQFYCRSQELAKSLRAEANRPAAKSASSTSELVSPPPGSRQRLASVVVTGDQESRLDLRSWIAPLGFGLAACVAIGFFLNYALTDPISQPIARVEQVAGGAAVPKEAQDLLSSAFREGKSAWKQWQKRPRTVHLPQPSLVLDLRRDVTRSTNAAGSLVGQSWLLVEDGLRKEHSEIQQMVRSGLDFLVKDLPSAAVSVAGSDS